MADSVFILADGIPAPLIFAGIFALLWVLGKVFGSSEQGQEQNRGSTGTTGTTGTTFDPRDLKKIRDRIRDGMQPGNQPGNQPGTHPGNQPTADEKAGKRLKNRLRKPAASPPPLQRPTPPPVVAVRPAIVQDTPAVVVHRNQPSETGRNVRLLLQPASVREAFLISEVLGKPKGLRQD
jgi:hypothetical protein